MNDVPRLLREAEEALRRVLAELGDVAVRSREETSAVRLSVISAETELLIEIRARARLGPREAMALCDDLGRLPSGVLPMVYSPVITARVAEILERSGVGYVDRAGQCRLRSARHRVLIDRRGSKAPPAPPKGVADPFSTKSSRIVRAMLSRPAKGWKVLELATHPDVDVAAGLVSKVKRTLVEEGSAIEHKRLLYLRDPVGLLENWARKYPGPAEQIPMYFRGDAESAERAVAQWCRDHGIQHALAGFSAAWRLAPEVRYSVGAVYVDHHGFDPEVFGKLSAYQGAKRVETGANLLLWRPFDRSVFADTQPSGPETVTVTSALQVYLDLTRQAGRGEEAAAAIYAKHLEPELTSAAEQVEETRDAEL